MRKAPEIIIYYAPASLFFINSWLVWLTNVFVLLSTKVLLFSQMTRMMDILEDYCILRDYGYSRLDGQMTVSDRLEEVLVTGLD